MIKEIQNVKIVPNVSFLTTLRNSGYNNYTAIADIVDNSLDNEVNSSNIKVEITYSAKGDSSFRYIKVLDDGCGMDYETLVEALKLGSETGKLRKSNLGSYGTGMKAAALSIGRKFVIKTKSKNGKFLIATFDLDTILETKSFEVPIIEGNKKEYSDFTKEIGSKIGTSITINKLDRIDNKNMSTFIKKLKTDFGLFYKNFINNKVNISINGKKVKPIDPMMRNESYSNKMSEDNKEIVFEDKKFTYNAYYISSIGTTKQNQDIGRTHTNAGLYIYRNKRLVGSGLDLGIIGKVGDGYLTGLRIELFVDGDCDELFGSTYMKMIHEKDKSEINQEFRQVLKKELTQWVSSARNQAKNGKVNEIDKDISKEMDSVFDNINENKLIQLKKTGQNKKREGVKEDTKKPTAKTGRNKFSKRKREDSFAKYNLISLGVSGNLFNTSKENGKHVININTDHIFWNEFMKDSSTETKSTMARMFVAMGISLDTIGYYDDGEKEVLLQEYMREMSENLHKLIIG